MGENTNEFRKRIGLRPNVTKPRVCLVCSQEFESTHAGNRVCEKCKRRQKRQNEREEQEGVADADSV